MRQNKRDNCVIKSCSSSIDAMMRRNKGDGVYYIEDITRWREDMNFIFEWQNNILPLIFATRK